MLFEVTDNNYIVKIYSSNQNYTKNPLFKIKIILILLCIAILFVKVSVLVVD
jgi:uncharacterized protein with PQ loop repeat